MCKSKILESIFSKIINNKDIVVGCVSRHPFIDANKFNEHCLSILNEKLLLEKNKKLDEDRNSTDFLNQIYSCSLIRRITSPTRVTGWSKNFIYNILSSDAANQVIVGKILTTLSDNLAQFLLFVIKRTKPEPKVNNYNRNLKRFDHKVFIHDLQSIDWHTTLKLNEEIIDNSFDWFFQIVETLLDTYALIEKLSRKKTKVNVLKKRISSTE